MASATDPLRTDSAPREPEPQPRTSRGMVCEFCECKLAANGDVVSVGAKAKKYRDLEEENEKLLAQIAVVQGQVNDLRARQPEPAHPEPARGSRVGMFNS